MQDIRDKHIFYWFLLHDNHRIRFTIIIQSLFFTFFIISKSIMWTVPLNSPCILFCFVYKIYCINSFIFQLFISNFLITYRISSSRSCHGLFVLLFILLARFRVLTFVLNLEHDWVFICPPNISFVFISLEITWAQNCITYQFKGDGLIYLIIVVSILNSHRKINYYLKNIKNYY